jgi:hypothetical protein
VTEIAEAVNALIEMTEDKKKNYCDHKESPRSEWKCCISGLAGPEPSPARLTKSMQKHKPKEVPDKSKLRRKSQGWDIDSCTKKAFPFQAHHLIPKKHLPTHVVCTWLAHAYTKHDKYQIEYDNNYDTDHANNGYCMPFVSTTHQWKEAGEDPKEQQKVAFKLMNKTGIQLHQGSHSYEDFGDEEEDLETEGYLGATDELLLRIHKACVRHVKKCDVCDKGTGKPDNVRPVESVVKHMDQASLILKLKIDANIIFVSERAYDWYVAGL